MSSTVHFSLLRDPKNLDIVDAEWEKDVLPDDDIILPDGVDPIFEESDAQQDAPPPGPPTWAELGLNDVR